MPQPHKGDRGQVTVRPLKQLRVDEVADRAGYSASQYMADLVALALGHPELVAGPDKKKGQQSDALPGMPSEQELRAIKEQLDGKGRTDSDREVVTAA